MKLWNHSDMPIMSEVLPDGATFGNARIEHTTPSEKEAAFASLRACFSGGGRGYVFAGETYCQLYVGHSLWMSDTMDERNDHRQPVRKAQGHVLIAGLGLGLVALACARKPEVEKVTVIEINADVIGLVTPYLRAALEAEGINPDKLEIIEADIYEWKPPRGQKYECIWLDVWEDICTDNLESISKLNRKFARCKAGYRGAWVEDTLRYHLRQEKARRRSRSWG